MEHLYARSLDRYYIGISQQSCTRKNAQYWLREVGPSTRRCGVVRAVWTTHRRGATVAAVPAALRGRRSIMSVFHTNQAAPQGSSVDVAAEMRRGHVGIEETDRTLLGIFR